MNFSNHCSGGTPVIQYYAVFGTGDCVTGGGYFSNSGNRVTKLWVYKGSGSNLDSNNYYRPQQFYNPSNVSDNKTNAGIALANGNGNSVWNKTLGCVPPATALAVLPDHNVLLSATNYNISQK